MVGDGQECPSYECDRDIQTDTLGQTALADVDGDGDLDICSKPWRPIRPNAKAGKNHFDYLENLTAKRPAAGGKRAE